MSQWAGGPGQPGFQYPMQTGFPGQQQPQFTQQQQFGQPQQQLGFGGLAPQPTGFPAMRPQPTGFPGGSPSGFAPQPTGFNAGMGRAMPPPVPPVPAQFQQQQSQFRAPPPPPPPQAQSQFMTGAPPSFLNTQPTGFAGGMPNRLLSQPTGIAPLVAQPTGFMDPRLTLMANNLLPGANYGAGLQQSFAQQTQERGKPKLSWALSKAEKKNYDQIFRAWDPRGTGFITGETALEVFGQSGLDKNDLARIWTLADADNRGKLNVAEFHVAMGLIYRSLNGLPIPDQLPPELKPPSARDTEEAVDFLKSVLKNDNHTRSTNSVEPGGPMSYAKTRSFNEQQGAGGGGRKDATVYKYDNDSEGRKVYKSSARHLDRDSVKTGHETASEDLEDLKRQLENSSRALENATLAEASRSREDEELDRELDDLKRRVKRVKDDLEYVSRGPRSEKRDEDRRELEREMTYLLHERIPQVQKKIEERDRRKERERREWAKDRDYRNDRFGRFDDGGRSSPSSSYRRDDRDRDTGYLRGTYDRDDRDRNRDYDRDRDYDRYRDRDGGRRDSDRSRERDYDRPRDYDRDRDNRSRGGVEREREPERARTPQAAAPRSTTPGLSAPPSRAAAASPASTKNMTPEERQAFIRAEAQRRTQERMIKLGLAAPSASSTPVDTDVEQRLARERKEAEEKARKAEQEAEEREKARKARLQEARGESATPAPAAAPAPAPPAPAPPAGAKKPPAPPPPKKRAPVPPPSRPSAPPAPAPVVAAAVPPAPPPPAAEPEEDPEEKRLRERREALRRQREELEREEREQEERRKRLEEQRKAAQAPPAAFPTSPPVVPAAPPAPPPPAVGGHNPFRPAGPPAAAAVVSPAASTTSNSTNPFFPLVNPNANGAPAVSPSAAPPAPAPAPEAAAPPPPPPPPAPEQPRFAPPPAHIPPPPKSSYNTAPSDDESWDEIKEKESDDDSSDDEFANRKHRENIAQALFGGILPSSPAPPVRPQSAAATSKPNTPAPASFAAPPPAAPDAPPPPAPQAPAAPPPPPAAPTAPPPPPAAAGGPPVARPAGLGAVLGDIRSGARLRKTVTNDRSTAAVSGRVIGDAAPPPHVNAQPRPASPPSPPAFVPPPPPPPAAVSDESEGAAYASTARSDNRQSVDWYAGLAAHSMGAEHAAVASAIAALPETKEEDEYAPEAANANGHAVPDIRVDDYPAPAAEEDPLDDIDMNTEYRALSLYPYDAQRPEELSFVQNMILTVYPSKSGSEWWYGRSVSSGSKGFIPKTYIKTVEPQATLRAHAIYPWEATNADELSLAEGDVLTVIDRTDPDWWKVEKDGLVRVVPASYMEPVDGTGSPKSPTLRPEIITTKQGDVIRPTLEVAVKNAEPSKGSGQDSPIKPTSPRDSESGSATSSDYVSLSDDESADDWSSDESDNGHKTEEQVKQERAAREQERQRVLEAAGLIIKPATDAPPLTRVRSLRKRRAPPPPPPASSTVHPPATVPEEEEEVPPPVPPKSPTGASFTLDDAYERYQQYQHTNAATKRNNRLSVSSVEMPPSPSAGPSLSLSWSPSRGAEAPPESRYGAIFALFGRSKTPGAEESQSQKPRPIISAPILGPVGTPSRESSPAFGSSWASLVDKSALEDMPKNERRRQEAIFELIATESAYVRDLQLIVETFYASMLPMLDEKAVKVIFANMEDILLTNTTFLSMLEERQKESRLYIVSVGDILEQQLSLMGVYMKYCVNHSNAIKTLQALRSANPQLNAHLNHLRDQPQLRNLDLSSFLLIPMQRITRYPLLIRQILHYTEPGKEQMLLQSALRTSEEILESINESIRDQENEQRLSALSRDLWVGQGRLDLTAPTRFLGPRKLLKEGELFKAKSKRRLHAVLCNDVLVLMDAGAQSLYRMPLPLHEVKVGEVPGRRDDCTFQVSLAGRRGSDAIGLRATSPRECQAWMKAIESAAQKCAHAEKRGPRLSLSM